MRPERSWRYRCWIISLSLHPVGFTHINQEGLLITKRKKEGSSMEKKARYIELRTTEGKPIVSFYLFEKEVSIEDKSDASSGNKQENRNGKNQQGNNQNNESPMTDPQKRFLFRILADQGMEGDRAHEYLRKRFQVEALKDATKFEASRMIEQLLAEAKGGDENGSPFE